MLEVWRQTPTLLSGVWSQISAIGVELLWHIPPPWRVALIAALIFWLARLVIIRIVPLSICGLSWFFFISARLLAVLPEMLIFRLAFLFRRLGHRPPMILSGLSELLTRIPAVPYAMAQRLGAWYKGRKRMQKRWVLMAGALPVLVWYGQPIWDLATAETGLPPAKMVYYAVDDLLRTGTWTFPPKTELPLAVGGQGERDSEATTDLPLPTPTPTTVIEPTPTVVFYVVQPGDSLSLIGRRYGVSVADMIAANEGDYPSLSVNPRLIEIGWKLRIPDETVASSE